jgi:hypothetical protein
MTKLTRAQIAILELAVEDWYGLWEANGRIPDREAGSRDAVPPTLDELIEALRELLKLGYVELGVRDGPSGPTSELNDPSTWPDLSRQETWALPPGTGRVYLFSATDAGHEAYRTRYRT